MTWQRSRRKEERKGSKQVQTRHWAPLTTKPKDRYISPSFAHKRKRSLLSHTLLPHTLYFSFPNALGVFCLYSVILALSFFKLQLNNIPGSGATPWQGDSWGYRSYLTKRRVAKLPNDWLKIWLFLCSRNPFLPATIFKEHYNTICMLVHSCSCI